MEPGDEPEKLSAFINRYKPCSCGNERFYPVNVAQRLQGAAKENQVIINETAFQKVKESFNCRHAGEVSLKNKSVPMNIYEVMD